MSDNKCTYRDYGDSCSLVYPPEDFEGLWVEHWSNGKLKYRGHFQKERMRIGQHICIWEGGALQEVSYWKDGWVTGTLIRFHRNGAKDIERDFSEDGGQNRTWVQKSYGVFSGKVKSVTRWKDDVIVAEWSDAESQRIWEQIKGDEIVARAVKAMEEPD